MSADAIARFAPAKINLYLHVTGRQEDGYHELDSLVVFADIGDWVRARPAAQTALKITGPHASGLDSGRDNLVMRAAHALASRIGGAETAALELEKNLPVASGIGGGSADAAATIKALARLWKMPPGLHDLSGLALDLGADVPVCLGGLPSYMSGVGQKLELAVGLPDLPAILVNPGVAVSTPQVFKARSGEFSRVEWLDDVPGDVKGMAGVLAARRNDLTDAAIKLTPVIADVLSLLERTQGCLLARMSGSGATCFGLFGSEAEARAAATALRAKRTNWWVASTILQGSCD